MNQRKSSKKNVIVIIQARQNSKRLSEKCFKDLCGRPLLAHVIERAQKIDGISTVIVATGSQENNQGIVSLAKSCGAEIFTGSETNVLERYYYAAKEYRADYIVRITGDNPFTDINYASMAVKHALETGADLSSISHIPLGTAVELIKFKALELAYHNAHKAHHFEHVTPYIKENPTTFKICRKPVIIYNIIPDLRLTIDTNEDFQLAHKLYSALYRESEIFSLHQILNYLRINPEIGTINNSIKQRPMTHYEDVSYSSSNSL